MHTPPHTHTQIHKVVLNSSQDSTFLSPNTVVWDFLIFTQQTHIIPIDLHPSGPKTAFFNICSSMTSMLDRVYHHLSHNSSFIMFKRTCPINHCGNTCLHDCTVCSIFIKFLPQMFWYLHNTNHSVRQWDSEIARQSAFGYVCNLVFN